MSIHDLIVPRPDTPREQLLLFHGVGSNARDLAPLGQALAPHLPTAADVFEDDWQGPSGHVAVEEKHPPHGREGP